VAEGGAREELPEYRAARCLFSWEVNFRKNYCIQKKKYCCLFSWKVSRPSASSLHIFILFPYLFSLPPCLSPARDSLFCNSVHGSVMVPVHHSTWFPVYSHHEVPCSIPACGTMFIPSMCFSTHPSVSPLLLCINIHVSVLVIIHKHPFLIVVFRLRHLPFCLLPVLTDP
jgi:hypothetical protein